MDIKKDSGGGGEPGFQVFVFQGESLLMAGAGLVVLLPIEDITGRAQPGSKGKGGHDGECPNNQKDNGDG